jgi:hypothetical protein
MIQMIDKFLKYNMNILFGDSNVKPTVRNESLYKIRNDVIRVVTSPHKKIQLLIVQCS